MKHNVSQLALAMPEGPATASTQQLKKLQKDLRELLAMLSGPVTARGAVHPIRPLKANRHAAPNPARPAAVKSLFDAGVKPRKD